MTYETINVDIPVDMVICRVSYIIHVTWVDEPIAIWPKIESRPHTRTEPKFGSFFGWKGTGTKPAISGISTPWKINMEPENTPN